MVNGILKNARPLDDRPPYMHYEPILQSRSRTQNLDIGVVGIRGMQCVANFGMDRKFWMDREFWN